MLAVNAISEDLYLVLASASLLVAPIIIWAVFSVLLWLSRQAPDIESLSEAVDDMLTLGIASTVGAFIAAVALARFLGILDRGIGSIITVGLGYVIVAVAIPAISKLRTVRDVWLPMLRRRG